MVCCVMCALCLSKSDCRECSTRAQDRLQPATDASFLAGNHCRCLRGQTQAHSHLQTLKPCSHLHQTVSMPLVKTCTSKSYPVVKCPTSGHHHKVFDQHTAIDFVLTVVCTLSNTDLYLFNFKRLHLG